VSSSARWDPKTGSASPSDWSTALMSSVFTVGKKCLTLKWSRDPGLKKKIVYWSSKFKLTERRTGRKSLTIWRVESVSSAVRGGIITLTLISRKIGGPRRRTRRSSTFTLSMAIGGLRSPSFYQAAQTTTSKTISILLWSAKWSSNRVKPALNVFTRVNHKGWSKRPPLFSNSPFLRTLSTGTRRQVIK
jgi:hypothetical protein